LIVVGVVGNGFTIADPTDAGMMDVVGFDAGVPQIMADFMRTWALATGRGSPIQEGRAMATDVATCSSALQ
jgi:hypothetical protein